MALVGHTGAGKSSIINILLRFYDIKSGSITIDGHDIRDVTTESLRRQVGLVLQDPFLFSGSIRDNIRYGRLDATDEQVVGAAKAVNLHDFVESLPFGYDTEVQERGSTLSQGQRQLLSFARALIADPRILVLDEATSSVDTATEKLIQQALDVLMKGRTSFVIAHRLSTIKAATEIVVLHHGEIIERGTHTELLSREGYYYNLYSMQFRYQELGLEHNVFGGDEDGKGDGQAAPALPPPAPDRPHPHPRGLSVPRWLPGASLLLGARHHVRWPRPPSARCAGAGPGQSAPPAAPPGGAPGGAVVRHHPGPRGVGRPAARPGQPPGGARPSGRCCASRPRCWKTSPCGTPSRPCWAPRCGKRTGATPSSSPPPLDRSLNWYRVYLAARRQGPRPFQVAVSIDAPRRRRRRLRGRLSPAAPRARYVDRAADPFRTVPEALVAWLPSRPAVLLPLLVLTGGRSGYHRHRRLPGGVLAPEALTAVHSPARGLHGVQHDRTVEAPGVPRAPTAAKG